MADYLGALDLLRDLSLDEIYNDVFLESRRLGILPQELAGGLVEAGKFRMILVDYPIYIDCLNHYLNTLERTHDPEPKQ